MGIEQFIGSEEPVSKGKRVYEIKDEDQRALLLILVPPTESDQGAKRRAEELKALVDTMGALTVRTEFIPLRQTNSATLIGSGKVAAIKLLVEELEIDVVIFDQGINPRVQRNLEKEMETCVIDRDEVILQIFADRAATKEATLQVELARLEYSLPRLTRRWTNLNRQQGGVKGTKGEGETQLELDRRQIQDRIVALKQMLEKVVQQRTIQRNQRLSGNIPTGAIVGYTNSGKSSLLNALTNAGVLVEDKLFATLDPTTRMVKLPGGEEILLSDTVGFISDLPHNLVNAFKSTLEEAKYADFLIIVCDASHPDMIASYTTTVQVLEELGCTDKPAIVLANKMDKVEDAFAVSRLKSLYTPVLETSIKTGAGLDALLTQIGITLHELCPTTTYLIPNSRHDLVAHIHRFGQVESIDYTEEGILVKSRIQERFQGQLHPFRYEQ
ncbi:MAG: GTPase HflX [Sphaerochaeta associata]|uniref:GTPase HflX n=1 Tax=Sphaerochaeta associata TaxID=1129264 RepID=UPI002B211556|nr:GTPase HflX [Sphaerochaeta associata]MEA5027540.1 GTPase HflX [Sphaerochaeta associata]